ncbi:MAG: hypothetical protein ACYC5N_06945 [Endomicrobiales bacterium]
MKSLRYFIFALTVLSGFASCAFASVSWIPLRLSLFPPVMFLPSADVYGFDLGLLATESNNLIGLQVSPLYFHVVNDFKGIQVTAITNNANNPFMGLQASGVMKVSTDFIGIQVSLLNIADNGTGLQVAGVVNHWSYAKFFSPL